MAAIAAAASRPRHELMREALHARAMVAGGGRCLRRFADDTAPALASGCEGAAIALVERSLAQSQPCSVPRRRCACGGGAARCAPPVARARLGAGCRAARARALARAGLRINSRHVPARRDPGLYWSSTSGSGRGGCGRAGPCTRASQRVADIESVPGLRLVAEAPPPVPPPVATPPGVAEAPPAASPNVAVAAPASDPARGCLSFGPFADAAARDAFAPGTGVGAATGRPRTGRPARARLAGRCFRRSPAARPPWPGRAHQGRRHQRPLRDGRRPGANSIALSRFGGEEAARRREVELRARASRRRLRRWAATRRSGGSTCACRRMPIARRSRRSVPRGRWPATPALTRGGPRHDRLESGQRRFSSAGRATAL